MIETIGPRRKAGNIAVKTRQSRETDVKFPLMPVKTRHSSPEPDGYAHNQDPWLSLGNNPGGQ